MFSEKDTPLFNIFLKQIEVFTRQDLFIQNLLHMLKKSFVASACSVRFLEEGKLSKGVGVGYKYETRRNHPVSMDKITREILRQPNPLYISDIQKNEFLSQKRKNSYVEEGFKSCVFLPLVVEEQMTFGILSVYFSRMKAVNEMKLKNMPIPLTSDLVDKYMGPILEAALNGDFNLIKNI